MSQLFQKALTDNERDAAKSSLKKIGKTQKNMDIACSRGFYLLRQILQYNLTRDCPLFDEVGLARLKNLKY